MIKEDFKISFPSTRISGIPEKNTPLQGIGPVLDICKWALLAL